jgi:hypothetical protein
VKRAVVHGGGVAAVCCARVLAARGWTVRLSGVRVAPRPPLVLNQATVALLRDLFGSTRITGSHVVRGRRVRWGVAPAVDVREPALVVRGDDLVATLTGRLVVEERLSVRLDAGAVESGGDGEWIVSAGHEAAPGAVRHTWGARKILATEVALADPANAMASHMETTAGGWVFMAPTGRSTAVVQAMVPAVAPDPERQLEALVGAAGEIARRVDRVTAPVTVFDAAPALAESPGREGWIGVGEQVMRQDPLSGEGVGQAARGAVLAACVIDDGASAIALAARLAHYRARLETTMAAHLRGCRAFYAAAGFDASWREERAELERGLTALAARLAGWGGFRLGLRGFSLVPIASMQGG